MPGSSIHFETAASPAWSARGCTRRLPDHEEVGGEDVRIRALQLVAAA